METENKEPSDQGKQAGNEPSIIDGKQVISYNMSERERPGGMRIRYKIRIVTGQRAKAVDARQVQVLREVLQWSRQHRQQR
jgi:hypothetical protein